MKVLSLFSLTLLTSLFSGYSIAASTCLTDKYFACVSPEIFAQTSIMLSSPIAQTNPNEMKTVQKLFGRIVETGGCVLGGGMSPNKTGHIEIVHPPFTPLSSSPGRAGEIERAAFSYGKLVGIKFIGLEKTFFVYQDFLVQCK